MKDDFLKDVGHRIKLIRKVLDLRQKDFADSIGLSFSYLSEIEKGTKSKPQVNVFYKISEAYNVSLDYLFHGRGDMFVDEKPGTAEHFPDGIANIVDIIWLMKHSQMFKDTVMGFCSKYFYENEDILKKSIKGAAPPAEDAPPDQNR